MSADSPSNNYMPLHFAQCLDILILIMSTVDSMQRPHALVTATCSVSVYLYTAVGCAMVLVWVPIAHTYIHIRVHQFYNIINHVCLSVAVCLCLCEKKKLSHYSLRQLFLQRLAGPIFELSAAGLTFLNEISNLNGQTVKPGSQYDAGRCVTSRQF